MTSTCPVRFATSSLIGGRVSDCAVDPPVLAVLCKLIVKKRAPLVVSQSETIGFRLLSQTVLVGSMRPGLKLYSHQRFCRKLSNDRQLTSEQHFRFDLIQVLQYRWDHQPGRLEPG